MNFLNCRGGVNCLVLTGLGLLLGGHVALGREFTLVVYNVENLFDADGIGRFSQYAVVDDNVNDGDAPSGFAYTPRKVLTKIRNIGRVLSLVNEGKGPEIILFQEFELDRSPESGVADYEAFLGEYANTTVDAMLTTGFDDAVAGLPSEALLLKYLEDNGLAGYHVIKPVPNRPPEERTAQNNVVFSKFPIQYVKFHPLVRARDIVEVGLSVDGYSLVIFDNHWKSGASSQDMELLRIQNAGVLRERLDELLAKDPSADIILGGDFNSAYNQKVRHPEMKQTALNDVLRSRNDEKALVEDDEVDLYNLWQEAPWEKRGSDTYRGRWGTLMQVMLTRGLYDFKGVQYVDDSFFVLSKAGLNAGEAFGRPRRWHFFGRDGGGYSDHFPVGARFRTVEDDDADRFISMNHPGGPDADGEKSGPVLVDYKGLEASMVRPVDELADIAEAGLVERFGVVYEVEAELIVGESETGVRIGDRYFSVGSFSRKIRDTLKNKGNGAIVHFWGELGEYRKSLNFLIRDESWLKN